MTYGLALLMAAVLVWEDSLPDPAAAVGAFALTPYSLLHGISIDGGPPSILTLVTSLFLHAGVVHLLGNLAVLLAVGPAVERRCGPLRFLGLFLSSGLLGGLAQIAVFPGSHVPVVGASGAISGILGAYAVRYPLAMPFGVPVMPFIALWVAAQGFNSAYAVATVAGLPESAPIAYVAHVAGFVAGAALVGRFEPRSR